MADEDEVVLNHGALDVLVDAPARAVRKRYIDKTTGRRLSRMEVDELLRQQAVDAAVAVTAVTTKADQAAETAQEASTVATGALEALEGVRTAVQTAQTVVEGVQTDLAPLKADKTAGDAVKTATFLAKLDTHVAARKAFRAKPNGQKDLAACRQELDEQGKMLIMLALYIKRDAKADQEG